MSSRGRAGYLPADETGIGSLGAVLSPLDSTRKAPGLAVHPGIYLAGLGVWERQVGRLERLTDIGESRLDAMNLRSVLGSEHESMNGFHGSRDPLLLPDMVPVPGMVPVNPVNVVAVAVSCI